MKRVNFINFFAASALLASVVGCSDDDYKIINPSDISNFMFWNQPLPQMSFTSDFESENNLFTVINMPEGSTTSISGDTGDAEVIFTPTSPTTAGNMTTMGVNIFVASPNPITEDLLFTDMVISITDSLQTIKSRSFDILVSAEEE